MSSRLQSLRFRVGTHQFKMSLLCVPGLLQVCLFVCIVSFASSIYQISVSIVQDLALLTIIFCILNLHLNYCLIVPLARAKNVDWLSSCPEIIWRVIERAGFESNFHFLIKIVHYLWTRFHWLITIFLLVVSLKKRRKKNRRSLKHLQNGNKR